MRVSVLSCPYTPMSFASLSKGMSIYLSTMIHVSDMARSVAFDELFGCERRTGEINEHVNELMVGDGSLVLRSSEDGPMPDIGSRAYLILVVPADGSIDRIQQACKDQGFAFGFEIRDDGFGRFFLVHDPDGYPVTIDERA